MATCIPFYSDEKIGGKIYGLIDPISGKLRYIGKTVKSIKYRLYRHRYRAIEGKKTHCYDWLRSLLDKGFNPIVWVIQDGIELREELDIAEKAWIKYFRDIQKVSLTNHTDGGEGGPMDKEIRLKISSSKKGKSTMSLEAKKKMSKIMSGSGNKFYGKKHSKISIVKMSSSHRLSYINGKLNQHSLKTHCKHGHEFSEENTYLRKGGARGCKMCKRLRRIKV